MPYIVLIYDRGADPEVDAPIERIGPIAKSDIASVVARQIEGEDAHLGLEPRKVFVVALEPRRAAIGTAHHFGGEVAIGLMMTSSRP